MAVDYTTTALLASVKRRGMIPASDEALSDDDILELLNDELFSYIVPLIMSVREEYFATSSTHSVTGAVNIPERAIGGKLRYVRIASAAGGYDDLPRIDPERVDEWSATGGNAEAYYLQGNQVVLVPTPSSAVTIQLGWFRRPSRLVQTSACAKIASTVTASTSVTATASAPATFTTTTPVDIISGTSGFDSVDDDNTISTAVGTAITLGTAITAAKNDYVCLAGESPIPQIPVELQPLLAQRGVWRVAEALGTAQKAGMAAEAAARLESSALKLLTPRVEGASRVVVNRYGPGFRRTRGPGPRW